MKHKFMFFLFCLLFISCTHFGPGDIFSKGNDVNFRAKKIAEVEPPKTYTNVDEYNVLIFTDAHFGSSKALDSHEKLFTYLKNLSETDYPKFAICLGDVANSGKEDDYKDYEKFCNKLLEDFNIQVYTIVGNHDLYNAGYENFKTYTTPGQTLYKFITKNFSWYAFDSGTGMIGKNQLAEIEEKLKSDSNPKIILMHYPILAKDFVFCLQDTTERNLLLKLYAENNVKIIFSGHIHDYNVADCEIFCEYTLPAYRNKQLWGILHVNENTEEIIFSLVE